MINETGGFIFYRVAHVLFPILFSSHVLYRLLFLIHNLSCTNMCHIAENFISRRHTLIVCMFSRTWPEGHAVSRRPLRTAVETWDFHLSILVSRILENMRMFFFGNERRKYAFPWLFF
jgi:hypothetical protein